MVSVFSYLHAAFAPILTTEFLTNPSGVASFNRFLTELKKQKADPKVSRLTICIAIDLKVNNIDPINYFKVFCAIDWSSASSLPEKFHKATIDKNFYCSLLPDKSCTTFDEQYVRVMTLAAFERSYVPSIEDSILVVGNDDELTIEKLYLNTNKSLPFKDDGRTMRGIKDCAWILPFKSVEDIALGNYANDWADVFVDRAGFHIGEYPKRYDPATSTDPEFRYMFLLYPSDFAEAVYKPLSVHADWRDPFPYPYISSEHMNGWGQTHNMDVAIVPVETFNERIHLPFFLFSSSTHGSLYEIKAYGGSSLRQNHYFAMYLHEAYTEALNRFNSLP